MHTRPYQRTALSLCLLLILLLVARVGQGERAARAQEELCQGDFLPVAPPLTELGSDEYVRMDGGPTGFRGGLYPGGTNRRPPEHEAAALAAAARIQPLDEAGQPAPDGKIVLMSVGMSNTSSEFNGFMSLTHENGLHLSNPALVLVNGAQGGRVSDWWADPESAVWPELDGRLHHKRVSHAQVQAVWIKLTQTRGGDFPAKAEALQADLVRVVQNLKAYFPNLQIAYLSSRTRSYMYGRGLSPEPVAYETGFAVKWLVEAQIGGEPELNFDPAQGEVRAPVLSWGPYLWIDGENARADDAVWLAEDMIGDCTHPSRSGNTKVAAMLYDFFQSDTTAHPWFMGTVAPAATAVPNEPAATSTEQPPTATPATLPTERASEPPVAASSAEPEKAALGDTAQRTPAPEAVGTRPAAAQHSSPVILPITISVLFLLIAGAGVWWRSHHT
ncbi:MAG: hypothetical protein RRC07_03535 [Anaerolineae bacterium]|nr:hypothetical protein [Anaerolineae bacterium]